MILIPLTGLRIINETIESVMRQECPNCEILILRNGIQDLPQSIDVAEKDVFYQDSFFLAARDLYPKKGKGECLECRDLPCKKLLPS